MWPTNWEALKAFYGIFDASPLPDIEVGQKGTLTRSRIRFTIVAVEGDDITIRYQGSRQDWSGKRDELLTHATIEGVNG